MTRGKRSHYWTGLGAIVLLLGIVASAGCDGVHDAVAPNQSSITVVMGASGYDWGVSIDGSYLDRLNAKNDSATGTVSPGSHQLTFHDNSSNRDSYPTGVYVPEGGLLTVTLATGTTPISWR
jgi:hypothetical protein